MGLPENFVEELDLAITSAAAENDPVEPDGSPGEPGDEGKEESVTLATQEGDEVTHDLPSEDEQEEQAPKPSENDADSGDPESESHEDGTEGDAGEVEGDQSTEPTPAASVISDYAMARAADVGITSAHANEFSSGEELLAEVRHLENTAVTAVAKAKEPLAPEADPKSSLAGALSDLDPEKYEPEVVEMFNDLKGVLQEQQKTIESFQETQNSTAAAGQASADREARQWFDSEVSNLGEDFSEALGKGSYGDLTPGSSQLAKRDDIARQCAVLMAGYEASGLQSPTREELFRVSSRLVLTDEYESLHDKEVSAGLKKRSSQHISRASGKKTKSTQSPEDAIAAMLDEKYPR